MELFYMALAWLFILSEYAQRAYRFVATMNAAPTGRHSRRVALHSRRIARHSWDRAAQGLPVYCPTPRVGAASHRQRQGMLTMPAWSAAA